MSISLDQDSSSNATTESESCCWCMMSWIKKLQDIGIDKEKEMKSFAKNSKSKYKVESGAASDQRSGSPSSDYVVIEKAAGEQPKFNGIIHGETENSDADSRRISPTGSSASMSSEAESTTTNKSPTMKIRSQSLADMPVAMKNAVGLYHKDELLIGGGYTGSSRDDATVHTYDPSFNIWSSLPPAPLKWSALATFGDKIVLIGGKEVGKPRVNYSNKLAVLDKERKEWKFLDPPMHTARMSPVVHAHEGYLIVAGGSKGSLDYNMEIFDLRERKWTVASPLPYKCLKNTSTTIGGVWYLLNEDSGLIHCADMDTIIQHHVTKSTNSSQTSAATGSRNSTMRRPPVPKQGVPPLLKVTSEELLVIPNHVIWRPLETQPPTKPFRITTIEGHLLALSLAKGAVSAHACMDGSWQYIGKLPLTVNTASVAIDSLGQLFLFGGEGGCGHYSNRIFKAFLVSKKPQLHVALNTAAVIINSD